MRNVFVIIILLSTMFPAMAQEETTAPMVNADSISAQLSLRKKFYYGYNFDIYFHNDTQDRLNSNGWSFTLTPEFGYKVNERTQVGLRLGGSYYSMHDTYTITNSITKVEEDIKLKV